MQFELDEKIIVDSLATKADVAYIETRLTEKISDIWKEISDVRKEVSDVRKEISDVRKEIFEVEKNLSGKISDVRKEVSDVEIRLTEKISDVKDEMKRQFMWFMATLIAMTGIIISVVKFL